MRINLFNCFCAFQESDDLVFAVQAARASFVEVPDPDLDGDTLSREKEFRSRSTTGPIVKQSRKLRKDLPNALSYLIHFPQAVAKRADDTGPSSIPYDAEMCSEVDEFHKIVPWDSGIEDDYWFRSDHEVSATDLWGNKDS
ncbi:hypothetical protein F511_18154 [Dorcoceras hygrometricum]|uniref:Uncharacterized protein n=1 Tax=Dorcoceras hygrometricum TaxID=472368 RepID=A0A2Z7BM20_9LAMI|nr:hypothetical protein F511_18154 [Dorcoceras hygrometricum]